MEKHDIRRDGYITYGEFKCIFDDMTVPSDD